MRRRGVSALVALATLLLVSIFSASMLMATRQEQRVQIAAQYQRQSRQLAESGLERARILLQEDPDYSGETWHILSSEWTPDEPQAEEPRIVAKVVIQRVEDDSVATPGFRVTADFPLVPEFRVRTTRIRHFGEEAATIIP